MEMNRKVLKEEQISLRSIDIEMQRYESKFTVLVHICFIASDPTHLNSLFPLLQASSISKGLTCKLFTLKASERIVRGMIAPLGMELDGSLRKVDSCKAVAQLKAKLGAVARHTICRERIEVDINLCRQPPVLVETKCLGAKHVHRFDYSCNKVFATTMVQEGECRTDHYFRTHTAFQRLEIGCQAKRVQVRCI